MLEPANSQATVRYLVAGQLFHTGTPVGLYEFDEEGKPKAGPAPRPLDRLETRVEGERLKLRFVKFRPGLRHSEPMES